MEQMTRGETEVPQKALIETAEVKVGKDDWTGRVFRPKVGRKDDESIHHCSGYLNTEDAQRTCLKQLIRAIETQTTSSQKQASRRRRRREEESDRLRDSSRRFPQRNAKPHQELPARDAVLWRVLGGTDSY